MNEPEEITTLKGNSIPRNCSVDYISFSAHVDGAQNEEFIDLVKAQHVVSSLLIINYSKSIRNCRFWFMVNKAICRDFVQSFSINTKKETKI